MTANGPWGGREPARGGGPGPGPSRGWIWLLVALAVAGGIALLTGLDRIFDPDVVYRVLLVVVVGGSAAVFVAHRLRGRLSQGLFFTALWLGIALALALGYAYRGGLRDARDRLAMELWPGAVDWSPGIVRVPADRSGHYFVDARVNGVPVRFLVDTGATTVSLGLRDARRIGLAPDSLQFTRRVETAAGSVRVAPVRLDRVAVGQIELADVAAAVNPANEGVSLLGMSFLARLTGFAVEEGYLVLRR